MLLFSLVLLEGVLPILIASDHPVEITNLQCPWHEALMHEAVMQSGTSVPAPSIHTSGSAGWLTVV